MKKTCSICRKPQEQSNFGFKQKSKNRLSSICKKCEKDRKKKYYNATKSKRVSTAVACNQKRRHERRLVVLEYLKTHPCIGYNRECGESDPVVLDFDHRDPTTKVDRIAKLISKKAPISVIMEEIAKCDVLCANCHRRKTAKQFGYHAGPLTPV